MRRARQLGAARVTLEVWTGNRAALSIYETLGFERKRRWRDYYQRGRHAFVMEKRV